MNLKIHHVFTKKFIHGIKILPKVEVKLKLKETLPKFISLKSCHIHTNEPIHYQK